jgi:hypothetical protein
MMFLKTHKTVFCMMLMCVLLTACATYYQKNLQLMTAVYTGKLDQAEALLNNPKLAKEKRNILLYYLNKGTILWMNGKPTESNKYFQLADFYVEDYHKNYLEYAASFLTNPNIEPYNGEGFEQILLHYYATMNYIDLGLLDDALVECKRMQQKLTRITDLYHGKNKYKRDAFTNTLMGVIYDAQKDYNNAFIAYRNAYEIYRDDYQRMLGTNIPRQLKKDLIRTAYLTGFTDEGQKYEQEFQMRYQPENPEYGSLVFFWNNGLGPIKDQWSINFIIAPQGNGWIKFYNTELNLSFNFFVGDDKNKNDNLAALKVVRVAFPKYVTRNPLYTRGFLSYDSLSITSYFDIGEDINAIAHRSLSDRMGKELGEALLRVALKQAAELALRKQNEGLGVALSLVNAATEQADTRNWQLLPYSINYTRLSVPAGKARFSLNTSSANNAYSENNSFLFTIKKGETTIGSFQTLQFSGYSQ